MQNLKVIKTESFALLRLDRERYGNSIDESLLRALQGAVADLKRGQPIPVVLAGTGDRFFCTGGDLGYLASIPDAAPVRNYTMEARSLLEAIEGLPGPTICALNGYAVGGGLELALAFDYRIAAPNARLRMPQLRLGVIPGWRGTERLVRLTGYRTARDLILETREINADEAFGVGLVDWVWPYELSMQEALCSFLSSRGLEGNHGSAFPVARRVLHAYSGAHAAHSFDDLDDFMSLWMSDEHRAAERRFIERR